MREGPQWAADSTGRRIGNEPVWSAAPQQADVPEQDSTLTFGQEETVAQFRKQYFPQALKPSCFSRA